VPSIGPVELFVLLLLLVGAIVVLALALRR